jgi:CHAD domain-containing protein
MGFVRAGLRDVVCADVAGKGTCFEVRRAEATAPGSGRDHAYHQARKAAKRLRYAAEAVEPVYGKDAARLVKNGKKIQNLLGEYQDCVIAQQTLHEFGLAANTAGESSFTYGLLLGVERCRADRTLTEFSARWPALSRKRDRRWLRG